ncbi:MAG: hypothetical protein D6739_12990 [Nitrospirae bacterium]|nr:MAG: hypothetical protein D6739_12990 [Nitrospirota bacterium]
METEEREAYALLDSGEGERLERFGEVVLRRKLALALWRRSLPAAAWEAAHGRHEGSGEGEGRWHFRRPVPEQWWVRHGGLRLLLRPNPFGHLGLFPEQADNWAWLRERLRPGDRLLNLFAYTGGSSLAAAQAGARVTHVDAVRGVVAWAAENARAAGIETIRWIVDDALKFAEREARRGRRYEAVVLDPPTFGRGPKGQVWKIERHLPRLLAACRALLAERPRLLLLSAHTPGLTPLGLAHCLADAVPPGGELAWGEMVVPGPRPLPSGAYARVAWPP